MFVQGVNKLLNRFPPERVALIREFESKDDLFAPEYEAITMAWCKRHICTLDPWPEDLVPVATFAAQKQDPTIHRALRVSHIMFRAIGLKLLW